MGPIAPRNASAPLHESHVSHRRDKHLPELSSQALEPILLARLFLISGAGQSEPCRHLLYSPSHLHHPERRGRRRPYVWNHMHPREGNYAMGGGESAKTVQELQSISVLYWGKYTYSVIFQDHSVVLSMKRALSSGFTRNPYVMKSFSKFSSFPPTLARSKVQSSFAMKSPVSLHATSFPKHTLGPRLKG